MKSTSLYAYYTHVLPNINGRKNQIKSILERFEEGKAIFQIGNILNVQNHTISGRFSELERDGVIKVKKDANGKDCVVFTVNNRGINQPHNLYVLCQK